MIHRIAPCIPFLLLVSLLHADDLRTVALSGDGTPFSDQLTFGGLMTPTINNLGEVAFGARVVDPRTNVSHTGYYREDGETMVAIVEQGLDAPGLDDGIQIGGAVFHPILLNDSGDTMFFSSLVGPGIQVNSDTALFRSRGGELEFVARENVPIFEGDLSTRYGFPPKVVLNERGEYGFVAGAGSVSPIIMYSDVGDGVIRQIAREREVAPGLPEGSRFRTLVSPLRLNNEGQTAFQGIIMEEGADRWHNLVRQSDGSLDAVARVGDPAPGSPGDEFESLLPPALNDAGQTAFHARIIPSGEDTTILDRKDAVYLHSPDGSLDLIARQGDAFSWMPDGHALHRLDQSQVYLNNQGEVAFVATTISEDPLSHLSHLLTATDRSNTTPVASFGDPAPGIEGATIGAFGRPGINGQGQVVFNAFLLGPDVTNANNIGVFAQDNEGELRLIVRPGDVIDVSDDPLVSDLRTIETLRYHSQSLSNTIPSASSIDISNAFNDVGQFAFQATFVDGSSGVFVSSVATVPEPDVSLLSLVVLALFAARFRRIG